MVDATVKSLYGLELGADVLDEIEVLSLNDAPINLLHIDAELFTQDIISALQEDPQFVQNTFLEKTTMDMSDPDSFLAPFVEDELFANHSNITNCNRAALHENENVELHGGALKCGDIVCVENLCTFGGFGKIWYIVDTDHATLRRIGIEKPSQYIQDPHIVIPGFVTQHLLDPVKAYST